MSGRSPSSTEGHPAGAANVPLLHFAGGRMSPNADFQKVVAANFPPDTKLVVGCKAGGRSLQAAALLEAAGYTSVVDMRGGFHGEHDGMGRVTCAGWLESKLPVETTAPPTRPTRRSPRRRRSRSSAAPLRDLDPRPPG